MVAAGAPHGDAGASVAAGWEVEKRKLVGAAAAAGAAVVAPHAPGAAVAAPHRPATWSEGPQDQSHRGCSRRGGECRDQRDAYTTQARAALQDGFTDTALGPQAAS